MQQVERSSFVGTINLPEILLSAKLSTKPDITMLTGIDRAWLRDEWYGYSFHHYSSPNTRVGALGENEPSIILAGYDIVRMDSIKLNDAMDKLTTRLNELRKTGADEVARWHNYFDHGTVSLSFDQTTLIPGVPLRGHRQGSYLADSGAIVEQILMRCSK